MMIKHFLSLVFIVLPPTFTASFGQTDFSFDFSNRAQRDVVREVFSIWLNVENLDKYLDLNQHQIEAIELIRKEYPETSSRKSIEALSEVLLPFQEEALRRLCAKRIVTRQCLRDDIHPSFYLATHVAKELLELNEEQADEVKDLVDQYKSNVVNDEKKLEKRVRRLIDRTRRDINALLTADQHEKIDELKGDEFDLFAHRKELGIYIGKKDVNRIATIIDQARQTNPDLEIPITNDRDQLFPLYNQKSVTDHVSVCVWLFLDPVQEELGFSPSQKRHFDSIAVELRAAAKDIHVNLQIDPKTHQITSRQKPRSGKVVKARNIDEEIDLLLDNLSAPEGGHPTTTDSLKLHRLQIQKARGGLHILFEHQIKRLKQLTVHLALAKKRIDFDLQLKEVRDAAQITKDQLQEFELALDKLRTEIYELVREHDGDIASSAAEWNEKVYKILSDEQKRLANEFFDLRCEDGAR